MLLHIIANDITFYADIHLILICNIIAIYHLSAITITSNVPS